MMIKTILIAFSLILTLPVLAANVQEYHDGINSADSNSTSAENQKPQETITYQEPTGVQVEFKDDGTLKKILASGEAELDFGDNQDERQALQTATIRAKASIAKFMNETIKSTETREEIRKTVSNATTDGNKTATRDTVTTQIEMLENKAEALLRGVVTLQQDIDRDKKLVIVTVGMKEQTIQAAKSLQGQIAASGMSQPIASSNGNPQGSESGKEIRRSKAMENF